MILGDEPLSPQSDARAKGLHYTVKERRYGYECLICGLLGDIRWIRSSPCKPKDEPVDNHSANPEASPDKAAIEALRELELEEQQLEQMVILQQDCEEQLLQGLLNEKRALEIAEIAAAKALKNPKPAESAVLPKDDAATSSYGG